MENTEYQEHKKVNMWNSESKTFEDYHYGECKHCGSKLHKDSGECPQYKCWIA